MGGAAGASGREFCHCQASGERLEATELSDIHAAVQSRQTPSLWQAASHHFQESKEISTFEAVPIFKTDSFFFSPGLVT